MHKGLTYIKVINIIPLFQCNNMCGIITDIQLNGGPVSH